MDLNLLFSDVDWKQTLIVIAGVFVALLFVWLLYCVYSKRRRIGNTLFYIT